ncbi:cytochrome b-c1 complex subunit 7-like [Myotis daubentonii]|uniref:cytochrome b-c1 complex subunit 7-like n=1 Tax=Myotis daubentonii TaxID=98922 RepID=UPI002872E735|nr:cytochrome b-c1 complex subunit 7-like [Myotis daubentonii]
MVSQHQAGGWRGLENGITVLQIPQTEVNARDTLHVYEDVKEASGRLPANVCDDRVFRVKRALGLPTDLPKEQWTGREEGAPYLKEVVQERRERGEWARQQSCSRNLWAHLSSEC